MSTNTIRKHVRRGTIAAVQARTRHGDGWAIAPDALAAFVREHYGRDLSHPPTLTPVDPSPGEYSETAAELRARLDATLVDLGRYRALAAAAEDTNARVEAGLKDRIAELAAERDAEKARAADLSAALERERSRSWLARLFGGRTSAPPPDTPTP